MCCPARSGRKPAAHGPLRTGRPWATSEQQHHLHSAQNITLHFLSEYSCNVQARVICLVNSEVQK